MIVVPGGARYSRREIDELTDLAKRAGAGGLIWAKRGPDEWTGQGVKALGLEMLRRVPTHEGDLCLGVVGPDTMTSPALAAVRQGIIARPDSVPMMDHAFCWIVDFPLFETDAETGEPVPAHHPFTAPHPDDMLLLETEPESCRSTHYDVVYNGNELGSGSIRITDHDLQRRIFGLLGLSSDEVDRRFGFLIEGLASGAPPHGGFALGFDRIVMLLAGAKSLRDVIAFPKTTTAKALFEGAPTSVAAEDLSDLHLAVTRPQ
jgi:aspartyl-tRNA synthetase